MPYPIIIIGESHDDKAPVKTLIESVPALAKLGYVLCLERASDEDISKMIAQNVERVSRTAKAFMQNLHMNQVQPLPELDDLSFKDTVALLKKYFNPQLTDQQRSSIADALNCAGHECSMQELVERAKEAKMEIAGVDVTTEKRRQLQESINSVGLERLVASNNPGLLTQREQAMVAHVSKLLADNRPVVLLCGVGHVEELANLLKKANRTHPILRYCIGSKPNSFYGKKGQLPEELCYRVPTEAAIAQMATKICDAVLIYSGDKKSFPKGLSQIESTTDSLTANFFMEAMRHINHPCVPVLAGLLIVGGIIAIIFGASGAGVAIAGIVSTALGTGLLFLSCRNQPQVTKSPGPMCGSPY